MKTWRNDAPLCSLLEEAAKKARGRKFLATKRKTGYACCFWGEAARMVGVKPKAMLNYPDFTNLEPDDVACWPSGFGDFAEAPGSAPWDAGDKGQALLSACRETEGVTIGDFRKSLRWMGILKK